LSVCPQRTEKLTQKSGYILFVPVLIMCVKDVVQGGFGKRRRSVQERTLIWKRKKKRKEGKRFGKGFLLVPPKVEGLVL
jgi:hypothetical protein